MSKTNNYLCSVCWETHTETETRITHNWQHICETCYVNHFTCADCWEIHLNSEWNNTVDWLVCDNCYQNSYFTCDDCWEVHHIDNSVWAYNNSQICEDCCSDYYCICENCDTVYNTNDCPYCGNDDIDNWIPITWSITQTKSISIVIPQQQINENKDDKNIVNKFVREFYGANLNVKLNKRKDIDIRMNWKIEVQHKIYDIYYQLVRCVPYHIIATIPKFNGDVIFDGKYMITTDYNKLWQKITKKESIQKIYDQLKPLVPKEDLGGVPIVTAQTGSDNSTYSYRLSNDIAFKKELFDGNDTIRPSCQKKAYSRDVAKWAVDRFVNGCNVPVGIYKDNELIGRMLCRLFYDWDNEYLFVDRMYLKEEYSNSLWGIQIDLVKQLRKHYTLAIPRNSEHTKSVYGRIRKDVWLENDCKLWSKTLRQPSRLINLFNRAYYHDSWTTTRTQDGVSMYDIIRKKDFYILSKQ